MSDDFEITADELLSQYRAEVSDLHEKSLLHNILINKLRLENERLSGLTAELAAEVRELVELDRVTWGRHESSTENSEPGWDVT